MRWVRPWCWAAALTAAVGLAAEREQAAVGLADAAAGADGSDAVGEDPKVGAFRALEALREALGPEDRGPLEPGATVYGQDEPGQMAPFFVLSRPEFEAPPPSNFTLNLSPAKFELHLHFRMQMGWPEMPGPSLQTAARTPQRPTHIATTTQMWMGDSLGPMRTRSAGWDADAGWGPVSVRGFGAEPFVVLDGVPLVDAFDGANARGRAPEAALTRVELIPLGGATAWGNGATRGVRQLFTRPVEVRFEPSVRRPQTGEVEPVESPGADWEPRATGMLFAIAGDFDSRRIEFVSTQAVGDGLLQVSGRASATDGFHRVPAADRGAVDESTWQRHRWFAARWRQAVGATVDATLTLRASEESMGGGTRLQRERRREEFASVQLAARAGKNFAWNGTVYVHDQERRTTRSVVSPTRDEETPVGVEDDVPATVSGATWTGAWWRDADARTVVGADVRMVRGESREQMAFDGETFVRAGVAGGGEHLISGFILHDFVFSNEWRGTIGTRVDAWGERDGYRRKWNRRDGSDWHEEVVPGRHGVVLSPSAGLVWQPDDRWRWRAAAQEAFRRPTLHARYVSVVRDDGERFEANPTLRHERSRTIEWGVEYAWHASAETDVQDESSTAPRREGARRTRGMIGVVAYRTEGREAIGSPRVAREETQLVRQWANLDRVRTEGLRVFANWRPAGRVSLEAELTLEDATVRQWRVQPELVGHRLPRHARVAGTVGFIWHAPAEIVVGARTHVLGRRFDDEENDRVLGRAAVVDLHLSRPIGTRADVYLAVENIRDARVETARDSRGVVRLGAPRSLAGGVRYAW